MVDILAVSQSIPGAIAMNSAGFIGYYIAGVFGAITGLLGSIAPPFFIVLSLSVLFDNFSSYQWVQSAFMGIRPVIVALIAMAACKVANTSVKDLSGVIIMVLAFVATFFVHPVFIIIGGIIVGVTIGLINTYKCSKNRLNYQSKDSELK